jgi:hypothetical protein
MYEYWRFMEKSAYPQQSESGSYISFVNTVAKDRSNISDYVNFHISLNGIFPVNDVHNTYLQFEVEREFIFTTDPQVAQATTVFLGYKQAAGFFNQVRIC